MTYKKAIEENEDSKWKKMGDEECDKSSDIIKFDKKKSFLRTKSLVISQHSLFIKLIHENDKKLASCSSSKSCQSRTLNNSCAFSSSNTRHKMIFKKMTKSLRRELLWKRQSWVTFAFNEEVLSNKSRENFDANFLLRRDNRSFSLDLYKYFEHS